MRQLTSNKILGLLLLFAINTSGFCLPEDKEAHLLFYANAADINQQTHHGVYIGNVQLDQGTTHIRASEVITDGDKINQITKATLKGNKTLQAQYWTLTATDKPPLHAFADIIYYYPVRHVVELVGHARVEQGDNSISAETITYNTLTQHVLSHGDDRTRTIINMQPEKHP